MTRGVAISKPPRCVSTVPAPSRRTAPPPASEACDRATCLEPSAGAGSGWHTGKRQGATADVDPPGATKSTRVQPQPPPLAERASPLLPTAAPSGRTAGPTRVAAQEAGRAAIGGLDDGGAAGRAVAQGPWGAGGAGGARHQRPGRSATAPGVPRQPPGLISTFAETSTSSATRIAACASATPKRCETMSTKGSVP